MDTRDVVEAIYAAWNRGELATELFGDDFRWENEGDSAMSESAAGRDDVGGLFERFREPFEELRFDVMELAVEGDQAAAIVRYAGTGRTSGLPVEFSSYQRWTVSDGLARRCVLRGVEARGA